MSDSANDFPSLGCAEHECLATPWRRLSATIIDVAILVVINLTLMEFVGYFQRSAERSAQARSIYIDPEQFIWNTVGSFILLLFNWRHLGNGQTIGKRVLGLRIVRKDGAAADRLLIVLMRLLPLYLAAMVPVIGPMLVLIDSLFIFRPKRNTLHDDIAHTKVVKSG